MRHRPRHWFTPSRAPCAAAAALVVLFAGAAGAAALDTGPGLPTGGGWSLYNDSNITGGFQHLAARFTWEAAADISSVQGWMNWGGGKLTFSVMSDFQGLPGARLHSATGELAETVINQPDWRGVGSLGWSLAAGTYWLVFEDTTEPGSGSMPPGAPARLEAYASSPSVVPGQPWMRADTLGFGVRINTLPEPPPPIPIPEPATVWLWALGVGALLTRRLAAAR